MIRNLANGSLLANRAAVARQPIARLIGLLNRSHLADGEALILPQCRSIHTIGMRFPIDVVFVRSGLVVKTVEHVRPGRFVAAWGADTVIELPSGTLARTPTAPGQALEWTAESRAD